MNGRLSYLKTAPWIALVLLALGAVHIYTILYTPVDRTGGSQIVTIPSGTSFRVIASAFQKAGLVNDVDAFYLAASLKGAYKKIKAGEYEIDKTMSPVEILDLIVEGRTKQYWITIPEGFSAREIAGVIGEAGLVDEAAFLERALSKGLATTHGIEGPTFEGYLFPDTYRLTRAMTVDEIIVKMTDRFRQVYQGESGYRAAGVTMTMKEVVTLASMIEKEAGSAREMAEISAVFHNRLKKGIRLQSDPTVIYAVNDFDGNLTKRHLRIRSPYNTYKNYGLPPGPIANPGRAAIAAALNPADVASLYFVARGDGTHHFSNGLAEHNRAVDFYQKRKGRAAGSLF